MGVRCVEKGLRRTRNPETEVQRECAGRSQKAWNAWPRSLGSSSIKGATEGSEQTYVT